MLHLIRRNINDNVSEEESEEEEEEFTEDSAFTLIINGFNYRYNKKRISSSSALIADQISKDETINSYSIEVKDAEMYSYLLPKLFGKKKIQIDNSNFQFLLEISTQLQYKSLQMRAEDYQYNIQYLKESKEFRDLIQFEKMIFSINETNVDEIVVNVENYLKNSEEKNCFALARSLYFASIAHPDLITVYFEFMTKLESLEIFIFNEYKKFPLKAFKRSKSPSLYLETCNEVSYILLKLLEFDVIEEDEIKNLNVNLPKVFSHLIDPDWLEFLHENEVFVSYFKEHFDELTKDNFKLHKKLALEGIDPNPIVEIIMNDDFDHFQRISSETKFDLRQEIKFTCYCKSSFLKLNSLIEIAAFFSSVKIFKFLLSNEVSCSKNLAECAVAGGNFEIIHICEDIDCDFNNTLPVAIRFHQNDLFVYLVESKNLLKLSKIDELYEVCVRYGNYPIIKELIKYGACPSLLVNEAICFRQDDVAKIIVNLHGIDLNVTDKETKASPLHFSCRRKMVDIVKILVSHDDVDVNKMASFRTRPIHSACRSKSLEVVNLLLNRKDIDLNDCITKPPNKNHDLSPIQTAARHGHVGIVKMLVAHPSCDINYTNFVLKKKIFFVSKKKFEWCFKKIFFISEPFIVLVVLNLLIV